MWLYSCHINNKKTMTAKSYTTISLTKHQYAGNRLANQRIISNKENCSADILEHKNLRAAATTSRRLSLHRESLWDVLMLRKYRLSKKGRQGKFECECKRRQCRSSSVCCFEKITYKFVRTIAVIVSGASHCRHQPIRHKSMPSKQSAYLLSTTLSMMLLINLTALQQVHGTEHIGGGSSNNNNNNSSSNSSNSGSNSSSSRDINRRLENIGKTQQLMRDHSNTTTSISSMLSENPNQEKRTWDSGMPSDINLKDVTNNRSVWSAVQSKYSSDSQSNQSSTTTKEMPVGGNPLPRHEILQAYSMESHSNNKKRIFPNFLKNHTNHIMQKNINVNVNVTFVEDHLRNTKATTITYPNSSVTTSDTFDNIINSRGSENDDSFTCNSCQSRERAKLYTLESIKNQILKRLRLEKPPNISTPIQVPSKILEEFYKKLNATHANERRSQYYEQNVPLLQRRTPVPSYDYSADMQNDEADNQQGYALARDNLSIPEIDYNLYQDSDYFDETTSSFQHDEYYSRVNSIFLFPSKPRIRHNKKLEILNFTLEPKHLSITQTIFHVYVRGIDWLREHMPGIVERKQSNGTSILDDNIVLTVHRALRKQNAVNYSHSVKLIRTNVKIPSGLGTWINIEVKQLSTFWRNNPGKTQGIIIKGLEKWMRPLIVTGDTDEALTAHIEVKVKEKRRQKRSISFDCKESDNEKRCCRYPLKVNFTNFGWDFVIAPTSFDAYFCNGECNIGFNPKHTHTYVASLAISASPCCSPTKMSSLSLLHFTENHLLVLSTIPNMSVEQCSCL